MLATARSVQMTCHLRLGIRTAILLVVAVATAGAAFAQFGYGSFDGSYRLCRTFRTTGGLRLSASATIRRPAATGLVVGRHGFTAIHLPSAT